MNVRRRGLLADRRGSVLVETALVISFVLAPLALGTMDVAVLLGRRADLDDALQAGLFYAWNQNGSASTSNVQSAAVGGYVGAGSPSARASYTTYCVAPATGYSGATPQTGGSCAAGLQAQIYVSLSVASRVSLPFPVPFLPATFSVSSAGVARVE